MFRVVSSFEFISDNIVMQTSNYGLEYLSVHSNEAYFIFRALVILTFPLNYKFNCTCHFKTDDTL